MAGLRSGLILLPGAGLGSGTERGVFCSLVVVRAGPDIACGLPEQPWRMAGPGVPQPHLGWSCKLRWVSPGAIRATWPRGRGRLGKEAADFGGLSRSGRRS